MSKMAQFAYIYGIVRGAGGNFSSEDSAVLHNDGDGVRTSRLNNFKIWIGDSQASNLCWANVLPLFT